MCDLVLASFSAAISFGFSLSVFDGVSSGSISASARVSYNKVSASGSLSFSNSSLPTSLTALYNSVKNTVTNLLKKWISEIFSFAHREKRLGAKIAPRDVQAARSHLGGGHRAPGGGAQGRPANVRGNLPHVPQQAGSPVGLLRQGGHHDPRGHSQL